MMAMMIIVMMRHPAGTRTAIKMMLVLLSPEDFDPPTLSAPVVVVDTVAEVVEVDSSEVVVVVVGEGTVSTTV